LKSLQCGDYVTALGIILINPEVFCRVCVVLGGVCLRP
jgi:hypothetical protein